jgi:hypothetical protein
MVSHKQKETQTMPNQEELEQFIQACRDRFEIGNPNATVFPIAKTLDIIVGVVLHLEAVGDNFTGDESDVFDVMHQIIANRPR